MLIYDLIQGWVEFNPKSLRMKIETIRTAITGIGSLPFLHEEEALRYSFEHTIPFLPQLPLAQPQEFMIIQTLAAFPGYDPQTQGSSVINLEQWTSQRSVLNQQTHHILQGGYADPSHILGLSRSIMCWDPFIDRLREGLFSKAKAQIAGPVSCIQFLKDQNGNGVAHNASLCADLFEFITARGIILSQELKKTGVTPLLFIDEPSLFLTSQNLNTQTHHLIALSEMIRLLKFHHVEVGIHCCGEMNWPSILSLNPHWVSFDHSLAWNSFLKKMSRPEHQSILRSWIQSNGKLSPGLDPQSSPHLNLRELEAQLKVYFPDEGPWVEFTVKNFLLTFTCGLAFHSHEKLHTTLQYLRKVSQTESQ